MTGNEVPFLDLGRQYAAVGGAVEAAVLEVLRGGRFVLGPQVARLEEALAPVCGVPFAVGVASGTDALILALQAAGIGPGDEVITSPFSFFASGSSIARIGAKPVFADIDERTFALDPGAVAKAATPRTRAVMPVHLYGQCADVEGIREAASVAAGRPVLVIEDAAQAIGARRHDRPAGSLGEAGCLSFYPTKNLGAAGDAGMVVTADEELARRARLLRAHGDVGRYDHRDLGMNSRLDSIQAAVLLAKLPHLAAWNEERRRRADLYTKLLAGLPEDLRLPSVAPGNLPVWHQYVIRSHRRDALARHLASRGIGTAVYYPVPLHRQPCFDWLGYRDGDLPRAEQACREVLALPLYPELTDAEQERVAAAISEFHAGSGG